jgi:hypothetical protein
LPVRQGRCRSYEVGHASTERVNYRAVGSGGRQKAQFSFAIFRVDLRRSSHQDSPVDRGAKVQNLAEFLRFGDASERARHLPHSALSRVMTARQCRSSRAKSRYWRSRLMPRSLRRTRSPFSGRADSRTRRGPQRRPRQTPTAESEVNVALLGWSWPGPAWARA